MKPPANVRKSPPNVRNPPPNGGTLTGQIPYLAQELAKAMLSDMDQGRGHTLPDGSQGIAVTTDVNGPDGLMASLSLMLTLKQTA